MEVSEKISERIKAYRTKRCLSQAAFSQELGIAKSTLQKMERGKPVSTQTLQYVSEKLGMELSLQPKAAPENQAHAAEAVKKLIAASVEVQELLEEGKWS